MAKNDDINKFGGMDEFDEFKSYREELDKIFGKMSDEEFNEKFSKIFQDYHKQYNQMLGMIFGSLFLGPMLKDTPPDNPPGRGMGLFGNNSLLDDFNFDDFKPENGWEGQSWQSPDGKTSIHRFTKSQFYSPEEQEAMFLYENPTFNLPEPNQTPEQKLVILETNLKRALEGEKYEDAAKIRDEIKIIKEELKK